MATKMSGRIDSKKKGNRAERALCDLLTTRLGGVFSRSVGSGNRWSQADLGGAARGVFSGDICVPDGFRWTIECKHGYELDLGTLLWGRNATIDEFLSQAAADASRCGRLPMVVWKRDRRPWLAIVRERDLPGGTFSSVLIYRGWAIVSLDDLISLTPPSFWSAGA